LKPSSRLQTVDAAPSSIPTIDKFKTFGKVFDGHFRFDMHVSGYLFRALQLIRKTLSDDTARQPGCKTVDGETLLQQLTAEWDSSLSLGQIAASTKNLLAGILAKCQRQTDVMPILQMLHRLLIRQRIILYKTVLKYKLRATTASEHLTPLPRPHTWTRVQFSQPDAKKPTVPSTQSNPTHSIPN
jgi:hypothetical protein